MDKRLVEEYRSLLKKHGVAIPAYAARDYDIGSLAQSRTPNVAYAACRGTFKVDGDSRRPMLILPPVREVIEQVRDELVDRHWLPLAFLVEALARRAGIEVSSEAQKHAEWLTGPWWKDRGCEHPINGFTHIVRSPADPQQETREQRRAKLGKGASTQWKKLSGGRVKEWEARILEVLADGVPRTFNAIVLEATGGTHTADVASDKDPDKALWSLVESGRVEHTDEAPVLFRPRC